MEKNFLSERKFLLTSLDYKINPLNKEEKKEDLNTISITSFPKIRCRTLTSERKERPNKIQLKNSKNDKIFLKNLKQFLSPINKSNLELKEIKKIKKILIKNKFKESHDYKLKIYPKNYYKSYGLNDFIIISNNNKNKSRNTTYRYNNISSYNNIFVKTEENKNNKIIKHHKKQKELLLTCVPYILKNSMNNNGIFKLFNNTSLIDENSIWRGKNINNMIHNSINIDFFKNFLKNSKSLGKIKIFK